MMKYKEDIFHFHYHNNENLTLCGSANEIGALSSTCHIATIPIFITWSSIIWEAIIFSFCLFCGSANKIGALSSTCSIAAITIFITGSSIVWEAIIFSFCFIYFW